MFFDNNQVRFSLVACLLSLGTLAATEQATAAELDLADSPLYLSTSAQPNILFIIDDSGSMDWETVLTDRTGGVYGTQPFGGGGERDPDGSGAVQHRDEDGDGDADCDFRRDSDNGTGWNGYRYATEFNSNTYGGRCLAADDRSWRFRSPQFNLIYFNPDLEYEPWAGVNAEGIPFADMPITEAMANPFDPSSETIDLTRHSSELNNGEHESRDWDGDGIADGFRYYLWSDGDSDGFFDDGEETEYLIKDQDAETQQNFANWFSYHRSREFVSKAAYGHVIANAIGVRMGLVTLHNHNGVNTAITEMNEDAASGNKLALLNQLYNIHSANGTPLVRVFNECGRYLSCDRNNTVLPRRPCPALSEAEGGACQQNFAVVMTDGFYNGDLPNVGNRDGDGNTDFDGGAYADEWGNTLADVAMKYYENDLHPHLPDEVAVLSGVDEARHQHVVTYTVAFGVSGTLTQNPSNPTDAFAWPRPNTGFGKIDDLRHAAYNGRGKFLSAKEPDKLADSLKDAINSIADRTSAAAAVALNTSSLSSESLIYQARFESTGWSGELRYLPISIEGVIGAPTVEVGVLLDSRDPGDRSIISYDSSTNVGIPFRWHDLSPQQQLALDRNAEGVDDEAGEARLEYLRGERSLEVSNGGNFRDRNGRLGDIIYSSPAHVAAPPHFYEFDSYDDYYDTYSERQPMVYVGANDGMLHGFDGLTGEEVLAYIPSMLIEQLPELTATDYVHRYYVDGSPTVGDAYFGSEWHTVLIGHLRGGGQALFALDVTNPASMSEAEAANLVLWEFTDQQDADLGYSYSQPSLTKLATGQWAAIFGNGYNNTEDDGTRSNTGDAVLYIVDISNGDIIRKISTEVGMEDDPTGTSRPNGLGSPSVVDLDGDFIADYVYAGDLFGNLWRFDINDTETSSWNVAKGGEPVFRARSPEDLAQPITTTPMVGFHPIDDEDTSVMVYFGTGQFIEIGDNQTANATTQSFYGIRDRLNDPMTVPRSVLLQQEIIDELVFPDETTEVRITSNYDIDWDVHSGWLMDFTYDNENRGEMQVTDAILRDGRIIFTTLIPNDQMCSFGGSGWLMTLNASNGGRLNWPAFDLNNDGIFSALDWVENSTLSSGTGGGTGDGTGDGSGSGSGSDSGSGSGSSGYSDLGVEYENRTSVSGTKSNSIPSKPRVTNYKNREQMITNDTSGEITSTDTNVDKKTEGRLNWRQLR